MKKNILANYLSQIYVALIGILILPLYVQYMGAEAYGLIGFFTMLQSIFMLLDLGLTPTISRETSRYHAKALSDIEFKQLYQVLHLIFIAIAVIGGCILFFLAGEFSQRWLKIENIPVREVILSLQIMAISIALRWLSGLYRGTLLGSEKIAWLSYFNILIATLRFIIVFPVMYIWGFTPDVYFIYQLIIAIIEFLGFKLKSQKTLNLPRDRVKSNLIVIKPILKFSLTIAFTSGVWVLITQSDKFILSGILPLDQYGYFTLAIMLASGLMIVSGPISTVIMPRMAHLHAQNRFSEMLAIYDKATQLVSIIVGSAAITLLTMSKQTLFAWTNDPTIVEDSSTILQLYVAGNALLAWNAFPYYLQYANGNLKYHLINNIGTVIILIPLIILFANLYGGFGTGSVWLILNILTLLLWIPFVHHKLGYRSHYKWLFNNIIKIVLPSLLIVGIIAIILPESNNRWINLLYVAVIGITALLSTFAFSSLRNELINYAKSKLRY